MRGNVEKSLKDFDDGLEKYFAESRKYRSSKRRGTIVLLDGKDGMFKFFKFLSEKCGLKMGVVHVSNTENARKAIEDLGPKNVKALVVDAGMLGDTLNGDSFTHWISTERPSIPVWVTNCEEKRRDWIRSQSIKIGVIDKEATLEKVALTVGFPKNCEGFIKEYAV
jgi:hypothetical protein